jgi:hypothetical protein
VKDRVNKVLKYLNEQAIPVSISDISMKAGINHNPYVQYILEGVNTKKYFLRRRSKNKFLYSLSAEGHCTQGVTDFNNSSGLLNFIFIDRQEEFKMMKMSSPAGVIHG